MPKTSTSPESLKACLDVQDLSSRAVLSRDFASEFHDESKGDVSLNS